MCQSFITYISTRCICIIIIKSVMQLTHFVELVYTLSLFSYLVPRPQYEYLFKLLNDPFVTSSPLLAGKCNSTPRFDRALLKNPLPILTNCDFLLPQIAQLLFITGLSFLVVPCTALSESVLILHLRQNVF